jgi:hypothetical protein
MNYSKIIALVTAGILTLGLAAPAFASEISVSANAGANVNIGSTSTAHASTTANRIEKAQTLGKAEIDRRIKSLHELSDRIGAMKRLTADQITQIQASITAEINILTALEATIAGDTSTAALKGDLQSITQANRVYMLVMPQAQITAASDRILTVVGQLEGLSTKLATRIATAGAAGTDVTAFTAALADMNAKIADAKVQANAAVALVVALKPDNGDKTIQASNLAALKNARTKLEAARSDIMAAYTDAKTIVKGVKGKGDSASVHATTSAEGNVNQ